MNEKEEQKSSIRLLIFLCAIALLAIGGFVYFLMHNKSYKNEAIEHGDGIYLNGSRYWPVNHLEECTITNIMICKTDTGMKLYEIKEYPDYEYVAGYHAWDGTIYKREDE